MKHLLFLILALFFTSELLANKQRVVTESELKNLPAGKYRIIKRTIVTPTKEAEKTSEKENIATPDQADQQEVKSYRWFVGAKYGYIKRERTITIDSNTNMSQIRLKNQIVPANGTSYSMNYNENESLPEIEFGILGGSVNYYGIKATLYEDFVEASLFAGVKFDGVKIAQFVPYIQALAGVGYDGFSTATPDNLTFGGALGVERELSSKSLRFVAEAGYQHRFWQKLKMHYGKEYWRDNEVAIRAGVRYLF